MSFIRGTTQQRSALMETQRRTWPRTGVLQMTATCATHKNLANVHPGLPLTTAQPLQSKEWRSSIEEIAADSERTTLTCELQTRSPLLPARCSLEVLSSATLLDLALMGNILSSQVDNQIFFINIPPEFSESVPQICQIWSNMAKYGIWCTCLSKPNMVKWGIPEKIMRNAV